MYISQFYIQSLLLYSGLQKKQKQNKKNSLCTKMDEEHTVNPHQYLDSEHTSTSYPVTHLWLESKYVTKEGQGKSFFNIILKTTD